MKHKRRPPQRRHVVRIKHKSLKTFSYHVLSNNSYNAILLFIRNLIIKQYLINPNFKIYYEFYKNTIFVSKTNLLNLIIKDFYFEIFNFETADDAKIFYSDSIKKSKNNELFIGSTRTLKVFETQKLVAENRLFKSIDSAVSYLGLETKVISQRCRSDEFQNYFYLDNVIGNGDNEQLILIQYKYKKIFTILKTKTPLTFKQDFFNNKNTFTSLEKFKLSRNPDMWDVYVIKNNIEYLYSIFMKQRKDYEIILQ